MSKSWTTIFFIAISLLVVYIVYDIINKSLFGDETAYFNKSIVMIDSSLHIEKVQKFNTTITEDFITPTELQTGKLSTEKLQTGNIT